MYNYNYAYNPYVVPYYFDNYYHNAPYYEGRPGGGVHDLQIDTPTIQGHLDAGRQGHCFSGFWGNREHTFILMSFNEPMLQILENGRPGAVHMNDIQGLTYIGVQCDGGGGWNQGGSGGGWNQGGSGGGWNQGGSGGGWNQGGGGGWNQGGSGGGWNQGGGGWNQGGSGGGSHPGGGVIVIPGIGGIGWPRNGF